LSVGCDIGAMAGEMDTRTIAGGTWGTWGVAGVEGIDVVKFPSIMPIIRFIRISSLSTFAIVSSICEMREKGDWVMELRVLLLSAESATETTIVDVVTSKMCGSRGAPVTSLT
jgi:hypothetical protein